MSVQETLRINPIAVEIPRTPIEDDILPLTNPIVGTSGRIYTELPIPKGTPVTISAVGYNMCVSPAALSIPRQNLTFVFVVGTKTCGVQTLVSSDRSVGSK